MSPRSPADRDTWRKLLPPALRVIDSLEEAGYGKLDFRLGGGTVLMIRFDHRISKDIDVFTHDVQALGFLSPQLNQTAERESTEYHQQANALKLVRPEGDIDFIVAAPIIPNARPEMFEVAGRQIALDHTAEILAKKLAYRADSFKARDVFDMATVLALDRPSAMSAIRATLRTRPALMDRLRAMQARPSTDYEKDLAMTGSGRQYAVDMFPTLVEALREAGRLGVGPARPTPGPSKGRTGALEP